MTSLPLSPCILIWLLGVPIPDITSGHRGHHMKLDISLPNSDTRSQPFLLYLVFDPYAQALMPTRIFLCSMLSILPPSGHNLISDNIYTLILRFLNRECSIKKINLLNILSEVLFYCIEFYDHFELVSVENDSEVSVAGTRKASRYRKPQAASFCSPAPVASGESLCYLRFRKIKLIG